MLYGLTDSGIPSHRGWVNVVGHSPWPPPSMFPSSPRESRGQHWFFGTTEVDCDTEWSKQDQPNVKGRVDKGRLFRNQGTSSAVEHEHVYMCGKMVKGWKNDGLDIHKAVAWDQWVGTCHRTGPMGDNVIHRWTMIFGKWIGFANFFFGSCPVRPLFTKSTCCMSKMEKHEICNFFFGLTWNECFLWPRVDLSVILSRGCRRGDWGEVKGWVEDGGLVNLKSF